MKKRYYPLLFLSLLIFSTSIAQTPRKVLLEIFTNASCGPCAPYNEDLRELLDTVPNNWTMVEYHVDWPSIDPMNEHNPTDPHTRRYYYSVSGVPRGHADGDVVYGYMAPVNLDTSEAKAAKFDINLTHWYSADGDSVYVRAVYKATTSVSGDLRSFVSIQEKEILFDEAPGYNGETEFHHVHKKMLPDANGFSLPSSFASGDSVVWTGSWEIENMYDLNQLMVVAFVQDYATKEVHQAAESAPITLPFEMALVPQGNKKLDIGPSNSTSSFLSDFSTTDGTPHDYTFEIDKSDLPAGWTATVTVDGRTDADAVTVNVPASGSKTVHVDITCGSNDDESGTVKLIVYNDEVYPGYVKTFDFTLHANPTNLVIDIGYLYDTWWIGWLLDDLGEPEITINENDWNQIDQSKFTKTTIDHIFTTPGYYVSSMLYEDEQIDKLTGYLDTGGDLFIIGQRIGYSQSLSSASTTFQNFYSDYLGASFVMDYNPSDQYIMSLSSDAVFGPLSLTDTLKSFYNPRPDRVTPAGSNAHAIFRYDTDVTSYAGIRNEDPTDKWQTVYCAWTLHHTENHEVKKAILAKSIEWFDSMNPPIANDPLTIDAGLSGIAYPNPADGLINFALYGVNEPMELEIRDLFGRVIARQSIEAGTAFTTVATSQIPSGMYVYQLIGSKKKSPSGKLVIKH